MTNRTLMAERSMRIPNILMLPLIAATCLLLKANAFAAEQQFPDVVAAVVNQSGDDTFDFDVTISSPYDTPARYADGFHIVGSDGKIYGERKLMHDHETEQPFMRELTGVRIPAEIKTVTIQARDQKYGWGGKVVQLSLPQR